MQARYTLPYVQPGQLERAFVPSVNYRMAVGRSCTFGLSGFRRCSSSWFFNSSIRRMCVLESSGFVHEAAYVNFKYQFRERSQSCRTF